VQKLLTVILRATSIRTMLAAIWKAGTVVSMTLKIIVPATENNSRIPAAKQQASRKMRSPFEFCGVNTP